MPPVRGSTIGAVRAPRAVIAVNVRDAKIDAPIRSHTVVEPCIEVVVSGVKFLLVPCWPMGRSRAVSDLRLVQKIVT